MRQSPSVCEILFYQIRISSPREVDDYERKIFFTKNAEKSQDLRARRSFQTLPNF